MHIEKFLSYKMYSDHMNDHCMILDFPSEDMHGASITNAPHADYSSEHTSWFRTIPHVNNWWNGTQPAEDYFLSVDNIKSIKNKRNFINHSYEPIDYNLHHSFWNTTNIDNCVFTWPNLEDKLFLLHSEQNSNDVKLVMDNHNITPVHWFANGYVCAEYWYKNFGLSVFDNWRRPIHNKFICMARQFNAAKTYRLQFLNTIDISQGMYSLLDKCPETGVTPNDVMPNNCVAAHSFDEHGNDSAYIEMRFQTPVNTSFLHVVMESVFAQHKQYLTEKVFKPIVLQQPFVLVGAVNNLKYLQQYGFKTFGDWWDESYDSITDNDQRLHACAKIVNDIAAKDITDLYKMREQMSSVLEHNRQHFYSNFSSEVWKELGANLSAVL